MLIWAWLTCGAVVAVRGMMFETVYEGGKATLVALVVTLLLISPFIVGEWVL